MQEHVVIGSRGSALALWQSEHVKSLLEEAHPGISVDIRIIKTKGDLILGKALNMIGGKGLFTKELEVALLAEQVDLCVHSMKDMPTALPEGLTIPTLVKRADPRDVLINFQGHTLETLPQGVEVATGSLRRAAQLRNLRPDVTIPGVRGNVPTRVDKVRNGEFEAMILAAAGVTRLGLEECVTQYFEPSEMIPSVGQGAIGIETREGDTRIEALLAPIADAETMRDVEAERHIMRTLQGGCHVPLGAHARQTDEGYVLDAFVASEDGSRMARTHLVGTAEESTDIAQRAVEDLLSQGAARILEELR